MEGYPCGPCNCVVRRSIAPATSRHCPSQPRGNRYIRSAPSTLCSLRHIPGVAAEPPPGWTESVDGQGVFLRRVDRMSDSDGTQVGPGGTTPDAWYVHGLAGSSLNWTALAGGMSGRATGYLVDLPGHGRSDPPPGGRYSLVRDADLLARLIRRRSAGPVQLIGNSLGGVTCTALAARHPGKVSSRQIVDLVTRHLPEHDGPVFLAGNGFRGARAVQELEHRTGRLVLAANQVLLWSLLASTIVTIFTP